MTRGRIDLIQHALSTTKELAMSAEPSLNHHLVTAADFINFVMTSPHMNRWAKRPAGTSEVTLLMRNADEMQRVCGELWEIENDFKKDTAQARAVLDAAHERRRARMAELASSIDPWAGA